MVAARKKAPARRDAEGIAMNTSSPTKDGSACAAGYRRVVARLQRLPRDSFDLWRFALLRLRDINATTLSAALCYRSIFALIPVMVLAFLIMKSVGVLGDARGSLSKVLEYSGLKQIYLTDKVRGQTDDEFEAEMWGDLAETPAAGKEAAAAPEEQNVGVRMEAIISQAEQQLTLGRLGPIGAALLIWTSLTLMTTIERSLNRIFEVSKSRSLGRRTLLYWSAMTLGPVAIVVTVFSIGEAGDLAAAYVPGAAWLMQALGWAVPGLVGVMLLAALYKLMPNTRVGLGPALGGALFVVPIWMVAKWGFSLYVKSLVAKGHLYGALGLIPLFLLWLYVSWLVFLLGAQLAHTAANLRLAQAMAKARRAIPGPWDLVAAMLATARQFQAGRGPVGPAEVAADLRLPKPLARQLLKQLVSAGLLSPVETEPETRYLPSRPLDQVTVTDVMDFAGASGEGASAAGYSPPVALGLAGIQTKARDALGGLTFAQVLAEEKGR
jgi:membrane protein